MRKAVAMTTRRLGVLCVVVTLAAWTGFQPPAGAQEAISYVRDGMALPLPAEDLLSAYGSVHGANIRAAMAGDCGPLMQQIARRRDRHFADQLLEIELSERNLCLPFNPTEAARQWLSSLKAGQMTDGHLFLAWKYQLGHGVKVDQQAAREHFLNYVLDLTPWLRLSRLRHRPPLGNETLSEFVLKQLVGRPAPQAFLDGLAWAERQTSTDAGAIALGKTLIWGGSLRYVDGSRLPRLPKQGAAILANVDSVEAQYLSGKAGLDGFSSRNGEYILNSLRSAGHCRHAGAAVELANLYHHGNDWLEPDLGEAEKWRRLALLFGAGEDEMFPPIFLHRVFGLHGPARSSMEHVLTGRLCLHR